uniref:Uncharacterized protein n=1 Tax=Xiphophorus maculatus TaxID=8083 RepID=A0A3B5QPA4_XIPMA
MPFLNLPGVAPVFCFFFADPLESEPVTEKKESSLPCVLPCLLFIIFLQPLRILMILHSAHLNCFSLHMNWIRASSSGSLHFRSTVEESTTSGFKNKFLASLYSQSSGAGCFCKKVNKTISSMEPCCRIRSMARLGPIPLMVPQ